MLEYSTKQYIPCWTPCNSVACRNSRFTGE